MVDTGFRLGEHVDLTCPEKKALEVEWQNVSLTRPQWVSEYLGIEGTAAHCVGCWGLHVLIACKIFLKVICS